MTTNQRLENVENRMIHRIVFLVAVALTLVATPVFAIDPLFLCNTDTDVARGDNWTFIANGPVHFSPVEAGGLAYFTSDDGHLYCVEVASGKLRWKVRGGPSDRKMIDADDRRLISAWPARGAPVVHEGVVYFGAGLFRPTGIYVLAVDAKTGDVKWRKEVGSLIHLMRAVKVEHVPLGRLRVSGSTLTVPTTSSSMQLSTQDGSVVSSGRYFRIHSRASYIKKHNNHWHWSERWGDLAARTATSKPPSRRSSTSVVSEAQRILKGSGNGSVG